MEHWNWRQRSIAIVVWPSFLAACLGTLLFFAAMDVTALPYAMTWDIELSAQAIYSIGFFGLWLVAIVASSVTTWLLRTERRRADFPEIETGVETPDHDELSGL